MSVFEEIQKLKVFYIQNKCVKPNVVYMNPTHHQKLKNELNNISIEVPIVLGNLEFDDEVLGMKIKVLNYLYQIEVGE